MDALTLAKYVGVSKSQIESFMKLSAHDIFHDEQYLGLMDSLDREFLEQTLPEVRAIYNAKLPAFKEMLAEQYHINTDPMSAYTLGNWLVGVLRYPKTADQIVKMHAKVPGEIVVGGLSYLLDMLDDMTEGKEEWKRAMCVLSIPLMRI